MKILIFVQELLSVVLTPFVLWYSLPPCAPAIVEFFRDFTIHVDGLGYVCSYAMFDFKRHGNVKFGAPTEAKDERLVSKQGKMEKSFLNFKVCVLAFSGAGNPSAHHLDAGCQSRLEPHRPLRIALSDENGRHHCCSDQRWLCAESDDSPYLYIGRLYDVFDSQQRHIWCNHQPRQECTSCDKGQKEYQIWSGGGCC